MASKEPTIITVELSGDPYVCDLFCPYCGEQILDSDGEGITECLHLIHADVEEPPVEPGHTNDLCFRFYEPAPACQYHYFVFREAGGDEDEDDDEE